MATITARCSSWKGFLLFAPAAFGPLDSTFLLELERELETLAHDAFETQSISIYLSNFGVSMRLIEACERAKVSSRLLSIFLLLLHLWLSSVCYSLS
jgi:hypothetical protein